MTFTHFKIEGPVPGSANARPYTIFTAKDAKYVYDATIDKFGFLPDYSEIENTIDLTGNLPLPYAGIVTVGSGKPQTEEILFNNSAQDAEVILPPGWRGLGDGEGINIRHALSEKDDTDWFKVTSNADGEMKIQTFYEPEKSVPQDFDVKANETLEFQVNDPKLFTGHDIVTQVRFFANSTAPKNAQKWVSRTIRCAWIRLLSGCQSD